MPVVFPWCSDNRFELLVDGDAFFPRMLQSIEGARSRVDLEFYLVSNGSCVERLLAVLLAARSRGVVVRCLFDDFGSMGLTSRQRQVLREADVELRLFNPLRWGGGVANFHRDHRKLLLVDGEQAYVGGTGITDEFWDPARAESDWHEVMVVQHGPVVEEWQQLFDRQWQASGAPKAWKALAHSRLPVLPLVPAEGIGWGRVAYASAREHRDILQSLLSSLKGARKRVWLATPYFLPTWKVRRALRKAASRGVEVRLLLTGQRTDNLPVRYAGQRFYPALLRAGVRIFEYQPRFLHLKMVLVDHWVSLGSCNFDHWNLRFNLDANLEAVDISLSEAVAASFSADFAHSMEATLEQLRSLPLLQRLQQRLWGWLSSLAIKLFDQK